MNRKSDAYFMETNRILCEIIVGAYFFRSILFQLSFFSTLSIGLYILSLFWFSSINNDFKTFETSCRGTKDEKRMDEVVDQGPGTSSF